MYREYYISSVKMEFRPVHLDAGNSNGFSLMQFFSGTTMDRIQAEPVTGALDYKAHDPTRPFKRFYRVFKYAKQKSLVWRSANDALTGTAGSFNVLPDCVTTFFM